MGWAIGEQKHLGSIRFIGYSVDAYCDQEGCSNLINRGVDYQCDDCKAFFCYTCLSKHGAKDLDIGEEWDEEFGSSELGCTHNVVEKPEHPIFLEHVLMDESWEMWRAKSYHGAEKYRKQLRDHVASETYNIGQAEIRHNSNSGDTHIDLGYGGLTVGLNLSEGQLLEVYKLAKTILVSRDLITIGEG